MYGPRNYLLAATGLALGLGLLLALLFGLKDGQSLLFAALGWAPIALVGVVGGRLSVKHHGTPGAAFPASLLTCILLRLILGLGGLFLAMMGERVTAYLTALFATYVTMQVLEMVWFIRRARLFSETSVNPAR